MKNVKKVFSVLLVLTTLLAALIFPVPASAADITNASMLDGASIRIDGSTMQGMRFVGRIPKNTSGLIYAENSDSNNFGIVVVPRSKASNGSITASTSGAKLAKAKMILSPASLAAAGITSPDTTNYYYFSAVITGIPAESVGVDLVARVYLYKSGAYSYSSNQVTRSVYTVASTLISNGTATSGSAMRTVCDNVVSNYTTHGQTIYINMSDM